VKEITNPGKEGYKEKTNKNEIHKMPTPACVGEKGSNLGTSREYADFC
jgi:hypothetical protein